MLTFEKILVVFEDYLKLDTDIEPVKCSRGYVILKWYALLDAVDYCETPQELADDLLDHYTDYLEYQYGCAKRKILPKDDPAKDELTDEELADVHVKMLEKLENIKNAS